MSSEMVRRRCGSIGDTKAAEIPVGTITKNEVQI